MFSNHNKTRSRFLGGLAAVLVLGFSANVHAPVHRPTVN